MTDQDSHPQPITTQLMPRVPGLLAGRPNTVDVLVRIQGPAASPAMSRRTPLNLALVLDRSGSMGGRPLFEAIRCAHAMIDRLRADDHAALVVFDNKVDTLVDCRPMTDKFRFHAALDLIDSGGSTNLHGGWLRGAELIAGQARADSVSRVLLLSDGQANQGLLEQDAIASQCAELAKASVTTSTYGLGRHFNEDLMDAMALSGQGQAYYGETADDLMAPFQQEFDLLEALCAKSLRMTVAPEAGMTEEVLNAYARVDSAYVLPNLAYESEVWALLRVQVPASASGQGNGERVRLAHVQLTAQDLQGRYCPLPGLILELPSLPPQAFGALAQDEPVGRRLAEIGAARLQEQAMRAARGGHWQAVGALLDEARREARDNPWVGGILDTLEKLAAMEDRMRFSKEARYSSRKLQSRMTSRGEALDDSADGLHPSYLRRKREQGKGEP